MEESPLLLPSSSIFDGANLIDCIRQSCIDLDETCDVETLLENAIEFLEKDPSCEEANEIIALILRCFKYLPTDPMPYLKTIFEKSEKSTYFLISFISVLSYLTNEKADLDLSQYQSFIDESLEEIKPQLNNNNLIIKKHEIPLQFKSDIIYDLLLSAKPSEQLIVDFSSFFFSKSNNSNKNKPFITKMADNGFAQLIFMKLLTTSDKDEDEAPVEIKKINSTNPKFEDEFFDNFMTNPSPETNSQLKKALVKKMLTDKSNLLGYLQIIFENIPTAEVKPSLLLSYFNEEYEISEEDFMKVLDNVFILHPTEKVLIPQPKYKPLNLPRSEFNDKIIPKLLDTVQQDPSNFQAIYCLELIANSFPFIFESYTQKVFEAVLPAFENYKLIYEKKTNDDDRESLKGTMCKASISALSFLLFALNSTKVFDAFIPWFFANIKNFTISQLHCFVLVFTSAFGEHIVTPLVPNLIKYKFYDAFADVLLKEVPKSLFGEAFNMHLYVLFIIQHKLHEMMTTYNVLSIEGNMKKDNIFYEVSGHHITHSNHYLTSCNTRLLHVDMDDLKNLSEEALLFYKINEDFEPTWTMKSRKGSRNEDISEEKVNDFIDKYQRIIHPQQQNVAGEYEHPKISQNLTIEKLRILMDKEHWILEYVLGDNTFPLLSEHYEILTEVMNDVCREDESIDDDDDERLLKNFDREKYLLFYHESPIFIKNLLSRIATNNFFPPAQLFKYFDSIQFQQDDYEVVFSVIKNTLVTIEQNYNQSTDMIIKTYFGFLIKFVENQMKSKSVNDRKFTRLYFEKLGNDIINFILKPQYRSDKSMLRLNYHLLRLFENYPARVMQIIAFMLLTKDKTLMRKASLLCTGIDEEQLKKFSLLDNIFLEELDSKNPQITIMSNILRSSKSVGLAHTLELLDFLKKLLNEYQNGENSEDESNSEDDDDDDDDDKKNEVTKKDFIIQILDFLAPDRDENRSFQLSDSMIASKHDHDQKFRFCPIPDYIFNTAPKFWAVFDEYRPLINEILLKEFEGNKMVEIPGILGLLLKHLVGKQFSSRLVSNYPECFSFDFRSTFFRQKQHDEICFYSDLELKINQDNLYEDSYRQLHSKSPSDWKDRLKIEYEENEGDDEGGLTKDWFTKIVEIIFNPRSEIFEVSEKNHNYSPSRSHAAKSEEGLEKLKFAGMIVARALMQGLIIPVHFTLPFLKQILHHEFKIKPEDIEDVDAVLFDSLNYCKENDLDSMKDFDLRFEVDYENETTELIENGSQIKVNNSNKEEYIKLVSLNRMIDSIKEQVRAFCDGFDSIIPHEQIRMFTPTELGLLICGVPKIDVDDMMKNVEYDDGYDEDSPEIKLFFDTIKKWDDENLAKLLVFITGTSRMPANGFVFFKQIDNPIKISCGGSKERLPIAHTCSNTLELPRYESEEEMNSKLLMAINVTDFLIK